MGSGTFPAVNRYPTGSQTGGNPMKPVAYAIAAVACLIAAPSFANTAPAAADRPVTLAQVDVRIGDHERWRERREYREHREGCRDVTIRERRGDETVVRHIRRCD
jgi:hypothetical protein